MSSISAGTTASTTLVHSGDTTGSLVFKTNDTGSGGTTAVTIDTSQNVGVGTTSPIYKLNVKQPNNTSIGSLLGVKSSTNDSTLALGYRSDIGAMIVSATYASTGSYQPLYFRTSDTNQMVIDTNGNSLFGITSFSAGVNGVELGNTNRIRVSLPVTSNGGQITFYNPNGAVGSISSSGSSTAYNTSSDYRLKENIVPMTGALTKVAQLKPVTYKWKVDGTNGEGFIAHELAEICPNAVSGEKDAVDENGDIKPQGIDVSFLIATLTAAIQELKAQNDALTARIVALEAK